MEIMEGMNPLETAMSPPRHLALLSRPCTRRLDDSQKAEPAHERVLRLRDIGLMSVLRRQPSRSSTPTLDNIDPGALGSTVGPVPLLRRS